MLEVRASSQFDLRACVWGLGSSRARPTPDPECREGAHGPTLLSAGLEREKNYSVNHKYPYILNYRLLIVLELVVNKAIYAMSL